MAQWGAGPWVAERTLRQAGPQGRHCGGQCRARQGTQRAVVLAALAGLSVLALVALPCWGWAQPRAVLEAPTQFFSGRRLLQSSPLPAEGSASDKDVPMTVTMEVDTVQKDCIVFSNHYYDIMAMPLAYELEAGTSNLQTQAGACCRSCHSQAQQAESLNASCNAWHWCPNPGGCSIVGMDVYLPFQACQLIHIVGFSPYATGNTTSITGPGVPFIAGGAVDVSVTPVPGYDLVAGTDFGGKYDYPCAQSAREGRCFLPWNISAVSAACSAEPLCQAFVYFPDGIDFNPPAMGILKGGNTVSQLTQANLALNPSAASYFKSQSAQRPVNTSDGTDSSAGGSSSGKGSGSETAVIAGVSAGLAGFLLLMAVAGTLLYVKVYRPRKLMGAEVPKPPTGAGAAEEGGDSGGGRGAGSSDSGDSSRGVPIAGAGSGAANGSGEASPGKEERRLQRSNSPPSVVDAQLLGVLSQAGTAAAAAVAAEATAAGERGSGSSGEASLEPELAPSPFMLLDAAMIAAMQAAAPAVAELEWEGEGEARPSGLTATASTRSGSTARLPGMLGPSLTPLGSQVQQLDSSGTACSAASGGSGHYIALPPVHPQYLQYAAQYPGSATSALPEESAAQQAQRAAAAAAAAAQQLPGLGGWEHVEVVQVAPGAPRSILSTPPASMANGSTARELLEAFAKLYRQRPTVDYSALAGMLEEEPAAGSTGRSGGGSGSGGKLEGTATATVSPQSTLEADSSGPGAPGSVRSSGNSVEAGAGADLSATGAPEQPAGARAGAGNGVAEAAGAAVLPQLAPSRTQSGFFCTPASSGFFRDPGSSISTATLPDMPWSDWALQPEEVEICRRPDGSWWQLGSGACGTVFKGLYHGMQPVAVKVLHQREDGRRGDVFMREVTMLKGLRDRNIVQFLGASLDGNSAMLVTEFMEFGDLWRALPILNHSGERVFGWYRRGRRVALDVARGLHYLHHKRVVHLDLKSANILLSRHGCAKICDIGMARVLHRDYLTVLSGLGTFAWSAPEVLAGRRCTEKVDIYSFAVVLWEICTGEVPVRGDMRALHAPEDCPQEVVNLYERCTAENPSLRPTAKDIVELLQSLPGG